MFLIGDMAKRTGVKVPTIRYYEKINLIQAPSRSLGNQRLYTQQDLERLSFIRHARELGFSLENIRQLIALNTDNNNSCDKAHDIAALHLKSVTERITKLKRLQNELKRITTQAENNHDEKCQVIQSLADHSLCQNPH